MNPQEVEKLLSLGEGQRVEFKSHYRHIETIGRVVCGFLNTSGGYVICGVDDHGNGVGVDLAENAVALLEKQLHEGLSPKVLVSVQIQNLKGKPLLVIEVPSGSDLPYAFRDTIYLRTGDANRPADIETIRDLVMRRQTEPERWERRFSLADMEADVDAGEIRSAVAAAQVVRRAFFREVSDPVRVLEDFSVAKYGRLTNGGDVLFAHNPAQRLPQVRVRAACYPSSKASDTFRDMKSYEGPLVQLLDQAYDFIVRNTATLATFPTTGLRREDRPLYPEKAVREGLVNAFAHRDYASSSGGITVGIYPDRLEIWNSGALPAGITPEKLTAGHLSILRNPDIAHVLYLRGLMEKLGRGSVLILQECRQHGLPEPQWTSDEKTGVTLTFFNTGVTPEVTPEVTPQVTPQVTHQVTHQVQKLLALLKSEMSSSDLMAAMSLKDRVHFREGVMRSALRSGLVEMTQPDKPNSSKQRYRLTPLGQTIRATITQ
jgi:ATP-dependent DNA helicase RecG